MFGLALYSISVHDLPITKRRDGLAGFPFKVSLLKEFFGDFFAPLSALPPRATRVADVGALEGHLKDEMPRRPRRHLYSTVVQIRLEPSQKLLLTLYVRRCINETKTIIYRNLRNRR